MDRFVFVLLVWIIFKFALCLHVTTQHWVLFLSRLTMLDRYERHDPTYCRIDFEIAPFWEQAAGGCSYLFTQVGPLSSLYSGTLFSPCN